MCIYRHIYTYIHTHIYIYTYIYIHNYTPRPFYFRNGEKEEFIDKGIEVKSGKFPKEMRNIN